MDKPKFELGQEVEVNFIGKITKIELFGEQVGYKIEGKRAWAIGVSENDVHKLPEPLDLEVADGK